MTEPLVSVALCTFNGAAYLEPQLASILDQARPVDEIVICDDGSVDATRELIARIASGTSVRIVFETNPSKLGVTRNFEKAISLTRGDIVFLSDQDDVWYPTKVRDMLHEFELRPELQLLHTNARLVDSNGLSMGASLFDALELSAHERECVHVGHAFDALLRRNLVTGATAAFRRSLFELARPLPPEWLHDEWLALIAAAVGGVDFLEYPLIDYRQHGNNQVGMRPLNWAEKLHRVLSARGDYHRRLERRAQILLARLDSLADRVPEQRAEQVREKLVHAHVRGQLPAPRMARIPIVLRELGTGRYQRCSTGWRSVVRDLFEPIEQHAPLSARRDTH